NGTFAAGGSYPAGLPTGAPQVGDFDGDGALDIYLGVNGQNRLLLNDGAGNFNVTFTSGESEDTKAVTIADFDNDGDLDVYESNFGVRPRMRLNGIAVVDNTIVA